MQKRVSLQTLKKMIRMLHQKLPQKQIAEELCVSTKCVSRYSSGAERARLIEVCKLLNIPVPPPYRTKSGNTQERINRVVELGAKGAPLAEIAEKVGITREHASVFLNSARYHENRMKALYELGIDPREFRKRPWIPTGNPQP